MAAHLEFELSASEGAPGLVVGCAPPHAFLLKEQASFSTHGLLPQGLDHSLPQAEAVVADGANRRRIGADEAAAAGKAESS